MLYSDLVDCVGIQTFPQYLSTSGAVLTLYDYLLMFDDEVRRQSSSPLTSNPSLSKVQYVWKGRKSCSSFRYLYKVHRES